jgi:hypothetical protein
VRGAEGERDRAGEKGRSRGKGGEMTQTLYAHMNKRKKIELAVKTLERINPSDQAD